MGRIQKVQGLHVSGISASRWLVLAVLSVGFVLSGCSTLPKPDVDNATVHLIQSQATISDSDLLDVRIEVFDPGVLPTSEDQARGLSMEIRQAEARYIPVELKKAIERTGHWGTVRVVPSGSSGDEVLLTGRIVNSNGEILELEINAYDATGHRWFADTYYGAVDLKMYRKAERKGWEVFQNVYNKIANDLTNYRLKMTPAQVRQIQQVAELRFAEEMAPTVFKGYLKKADDDEKAGASGGLFSLGVNSERGTGLKDIFSGLMGGSDPKEVPKPVYRIDRLPAENDEMLQRVRRIRQRDDLLIDTLDGHYEGLYLEMQNTYAQWRTQRAKEINMIREVEDRQQAEVAKGVAAIAVAVLVGVVASNSDNSSFNSGIAGASGAIAAEGVRKIFEASEVDEQAEINRAALEELGESFSADVEPIVVEVEGETVELTGTAQVKYQQWRDVLGKLYAAETGFSPDAGEDAASAGKD